MKSTYFCGILNFEFLTSSNSLQFEFINIYLYTFQHLNYIIY